MLILLIFFTSNLVIIFSIALLLLDIKLNNYKPSLFQFVFYLLKVKIINEKKIRSIQMQKVHKERRIYVCF